MLCCLGLMGLHDLPPAESLSLLPRVPLATSPARVRPRSCGWRLSARRWEMAPGYFLYLTLSRSVFSLL